VRTTKDTGSPCTYAFAGWVAITATIITKTRRFAGAMRLNRIIFLNDIFDRWYIGAASYFLNFQIDLFSVSTTK
jgi:hypothetical protein